MSFLDPGARSTALGALRVDPPRSFAVGETGFYVWSACDRHGHGVCGVTGECARAATQLSEAFGGLGGDAVGAVRLVRLDRGASQPSYVYGPVLLRLCRDETTGEIKFVAGE